MRSVNASNVTLLLYFFNFARGSDLLGNRLNLPSALEPEFYYAEHIENVKSLTASLLLGDRQFYYLTFQSVGFSKNRGYKLRQKRHFDTTHEHHQRRLIHRFAIQRSEIYHKFKAACSAHIDRLD